MGKITGVPLSKIFLQKLIILKFGMNNVFQIQITETKNKLHETFIIKTLNDIFNTENFP